MMLLEPMLSRNDNGLMPAPKPHVDDVAELLAEVHALQARVQATLQRVSKEPQSENSVDAIRHALLECAFDVARASKACGDAAKIAIGWAQWEASPPRIDIEASNGLRARLVEMCGVVARFYVDKMASIAMERALVERDAKGEYKHLKGEYHLAFGGHRKYNRSVWILRLESKVEHFLSVDIKALRVAHEPLFKMREEFGFERQSSEEILARAICFSLAGEGFGAAFIRNEVVSEAIKGAESLSQPSRNAHANWAKRILRAALRHHPALVREELRVAVDEIDIAVTVAKRKKKRKK